jgi:hypothetical protein
MNLYFAKLNSTKTFRASIDGGILHALACRYKPKEPKKKKPAMVHHHLTIGFAQLHLELLKTNKQDLDELYLEVESSDVVVVKVRDKRSHIWKAVTSLHQLKLAGAQNGSKLR